MLTCDTYHSRTLVFDVDLISIHRIHTIRSMKMNVNLTINITIDSTVDSQKSNRSGRGWDEASWLSFNWHCHEVLYSFFFTFSRFKMKYDFLPYWQRCRINFNSNLLFKIDFSHPLLFWPCLNSLYLFCITMNLSVLSTSLLCGHPQCIDSEQILENTLSFHAAV